jgi:hypothetical protein
MKKFNQADGACSVYSSQRVDYKTGAMVSVNSIEITALSRASLA